METMLENQQDTMSLKANYESAKKAIRKELKIRVRQNVYGCCGSCVAAETELKEGEKILWHFGGQGHEFGWQGGNAYTTASISAGRWSRLEEVEGVYFNHANLTDEDVKAIQAIFSRFGIETEWETPYEAKCLWVSFK